MHLIIDVPSCVQKFLFSQGKKMETIKTVVQNHRPKEGSRVLSCSSCGNSIDRDVNAARNILRKAAGLRFSPRGLSSEAVKGKPSAMVIPGVDGSQSSPKIQFEGSKT
jgi:hypothetical protein